VAIGSYGAAGGLRRARPGRGGNSQRRRALLRCPAGNVSVEFALVVPVLLFLMLGSAEMGRFVLLNQKMDRVATTVPDLVSRAETISESQVTDIMVAADQVADPFDLADLGVVIVTSITNSDGTGPVIAWQRSGAGSYSGTSRLGAPGDTPVLPDDFVIREGRRRSSARSTTISRRF
jgi:Flp pilus assembly protein TadG